MSREQKVEIGTGNIGRRREPFVIINECQHNCIHNKEREKRRMEMKMLSTAIWYEGKMECAKIMCNGNMMKQANAAAATAASTGAQKEKKQFQ